MRDYNDLVDGVVSVLEHWYRGSLDECHKAGTPTLNPREYISNDSELIRTSTYLLEKRLRKIRTLSTTLSQKRLTTTLH